MSYLLMSLYLIHGLSGAIVAAARRCGAEVRVLQQPGGSCRTSFKPAPSLQCRRAPRTAQAQPNMNKAAYAAPAGMGLVGLSKNNLVFWGTGDYSSEGKSLIKDLTSKSAGFFFLRNMNYLEMSTLKKPEANIIPSSALQLCITAAISKVTSTKTNRNKVYRLHVDQIATKLNYRCS